MWKEICKILKVSPNEPNPKWNPKKYETVENAISKLTALVGNEGDAKEIVELAMIGELSILKNKYPY